MLADRFPYRRRVPERKQQQIRLQLSASLNGVITQSLLPRINGGLQLVCEIMAATPAVRALIREGKYHNLDNEIQLGSRSACRP